MKKLRIAFFALIAIVIVGLLSVRFYNRNLMTIPGANMMPTLSIGDVVEIDRSAYTHRTPEKGEVVIYTLKTSPEIFRIGRVVGVPREKVSFISRKLHINDHPTQLSSELVEGDDGEQGPIKMEQVSESMGGHKYDVWYYRYLPQNEDFHVVLKDQEYFIAGDNRDNSKDSRFLGPISRSEINAAVIKVVQSNDQRRIGKELAIKK